MYLVIGQDRFCVDHATFVKVKEEAHLYSNL